MELPMILNYSITVLALLGSVFAWIAKIRWSKEFKDAKDAEIKAKIAQMDILSEKVKMYEGIVSQKLYEYSRDTISNLERTLEETEKTNKTKITTLKETISNLKLSIKDIEANNISLSKLNTPLFEIRGPLNSIIGFSELLLKEDYKITEHRKYIEIIQQSGWILLEFINDLIDLEREKKREINNRFK